MAQRHSFALSSDVTKQRLTRMSPVTANILHTCIQTGYEPPSSTFLLALTVLLLFLHTCMGVGTLVLDTNVF